MAPAQAFVSSYAPRLRQYANSFITPVVQTQTIAPTARTTKRGTTVINYADDAYDDDDFDDSEGTRRPTGLRSLRREDLEKRDTAIDKLGKEIYEPVDVQGIYREWMIRRTVKPTYDLPRLDPALFYWHSIANLPIPWPSTDQQVHIQAQLPLTLIPIRIDIDVPAHNPEPPFPVTRSIDSSGMSATMPQFRRPEPAPQYKLRDFFLWNLHESLLTPEDFATTLVRELDLPNHTALTVSIGQQIRTQLEDYAGVALHPLFHSQQKPAAVSAATAAASGGTANSTDTRSLANGRSRDTTPKPFLAPPETRPSSRTPEGATPVTPVAAVGTPQPLQSMLDSSSIAARASPLPPENNSVSSITGIPDFLNPDDTYRCVITLSISLSSRLYSDKFEWSLLHPPGLAELFAKQTCADLGLGGEWVLAITHAIYEAVLRLKKEACEGGMLMTGGGAWGQGEIDNQAVRLEEGAGWRYDADDFGAEWEPKIELLSKDEIEKREGDRERQLRRLRRETARFSSTAGMVPSAREQEAQTRGSYFDLPGAANGGGDSETPNMGRGERSKKKRRFRSLSPVAKAVGTPGEGVNGVGTGWGGAGNQLQEYERPAWRCKWCLVWGNAVWAVRDGPMGPRVRLDNSPFLPILLLTPADSFLQSLCNNCGLLYERDKRLPVWSKELHKHDIAVR